MTHTHYLTRSSWKRNANKKYIYKKGEIFKTRTEPSIYTPGSEGPIAPLPSLKIKTAEVTEGL